MSNHPNKGKSKYEFLLAMKPGEFYEFDNLPTAAEGRRKIPPTVRKAYYRINSAVSTLQRSNAGVKMSISTVTSDGSRIKGDKIIVTMLAIDGVVANNEDYEAHERRRQQSMEAWRQRKIAEEAPKLKAQLEEAEAGELARRVAGAVKRQIGQEPRLEAGPKYDPKRLAELVAHFTRGGDIQQLRLIDNVWIDDKNPTWTLPTSQYRKKPVVREFYLIVSRNGDVTAAANDPTKLPHHDPACLVHARELLPEEEDEHHH